MAASGQFVVTLTEDVQRNGGHAHQLVVLSPFRAPPRPVLFTGREAEIQRIKSLLGLDAPFTVDSRCLFCLEGKGGVGKISLGIHLAYLLQPHFPNSFLRAGWGRAHPIAVLCHFAAAYRHDVTRYADLESRSSKVRELPAGKRALIIFGDVLDDVRLHPLLPLGGNCVVVLTTGRKDLAVVDGCHCIPILPSAIQGSESLSLFKNILGPVAVQRDKETLSALGAMLGELTLALQTVTNCIRHEPEWTPVGRFMQVTSRLRSSFI